MKEKKTPEFFTRFRFFRYFVVLFYLVDLVREAMEEALQAAAEASGGDLTIEQVTKLHNDQVFNTIGWSCLPRAERYRKRELVKELRDYVLRRYCTQQS